MANGLVNLSTVGDKAPGLSDFLSLSPERGRWWLHLSPDRRAAKCQSHDITRQALVQSASPNGKPDMSLPVPNQGRADQPGVKSKERTG
jgi:hypothetical protein